MMIKICGVTLPDDAARIAAAGADYIGLNFWPRSKRYLQPERAPVVVAAARGTGSAKLVGVFVDAGRDEIIALAGSLDVIQLHGTETPAEVIAIATATNRPVWKAISAAGPLELASWDVDAILLDTPTPERGGSGQTFDWAIARDARMAHPARRIVLAGGLRPENVAAAIAEVKPWGVDVASGVEAAPGIKDPAKLAAFFAAIRG